MRVRGWSVGFGINDWKSEILFLLRNWNFVIPTA